MSGLLPVPAFWAGKRVLVTGYTGFKGSWLTLWLHRMGADVTGLALPPEGPDNLFTKARVADACRSHIVDLRDADGVRALLKETRPEIVLHLGAQALVRRSYADPAGTFATNVQGTVNLLDALADADCARAILVITSDKVYANDESGRAFIETDPLGGHDPYSLSKAACEHVVSAWRASRFAGTATALATARGGNVIGGGDYSQDRIVPDIIRAAKAGTPLILRNPNATRPWQHVLDCLAGYLVFAQAMASGREFPEALNIGPDHAQPITVAEIAEVLLPALGAKHGWQLDPDMAALPREMHHLALNPARARALGIQDRLPGRLAPEMTAMWYRDAAHQKDIRTLTEQQIADYCADRTCL